MERRNRTTKKRGNGEGTIYYSEALNRYVGQYYDNHGKRKTMTQHKNEKVGDFKKRYLETKTSAENGTYIEKSKETISTIAENHIKQKYLDGVISEVSLSRNEYDLKRLKNICDGFCDIPIQKVKVSHIESSKEAMREYSNSVIEKQWGLLKKVFKIAYSRRMIKYNIMEDVTLTKPISKIPDKKVPSLTVEEEQKLRQVLIEMDSPFASISLLELDTGARLGEILGLAKDCVDFEQNTVTIQRTTSKVGNKIILQEHTKTYDRKTGIDKGKRIFPMTPEVRGILKKEIDRYRNLDNIHHLIFWNYKNNNFITDNSINSKLERLNNKYEIAEDLHSHILRHSFVTRCQEKGVPLVVIQALIGHVEGSMITNNVYTTVSLDFMKQELNKLA